ncbi:MAG: hypothetical protein WC516_09285 [Patescibacteria group bacterium]|jgi:hypothetical protein
MNLEDIKTGDDLFRKDKSFLSKNICSVMKKWGKKKGYKTDLLFSHAARFIWIAGELYVYGSIDSGYKPWLFKNHYDWEKDDFVIMRRKKELSSTEINQIINYCQHLVTISRLYQFANFIRWIILVYLGINTFNKQNDHVLYCYQSTRLCRKNLNPENYEKDTNIVDIFQLLYDPNYKIIYKSKT